MPHAAWTELEAVARRDADARIADQFAADADRLSRMTLDAAGMKPDYLAAVHQFRSQYQEACVKVGIDYVPMDTSVGFDKALLEYLLHRQRRF